MQFEIDPSVVRARSQKFGAKRTESIQSHLRRHAGLPLGYSQRFHNTKQETDIIGLFANLLVPGTARGEGTVLSKETTAILSYFPPDAGPQHQNSVEIGRFTRS